MLIDTHLEIYLSKERKSICVYRTASISNTWLVWLHWKQAFYLWPTGKECCHLAWTVLWGVVVFLHHIISKDLLEQVDWLKLKQPAKLVVKSASPSKSRRGFKNLWCYSICILKRPIQNQTKQVLITYPSALFQSISTLHSINHLGDIIRQCQFYQYCQWLMCAGLNN